MSKKTISGRDKISAVILYLEGNVSQHQLAEQSGVNLAAIQQWIRNYESIGEDAFPMKHYKRYSKELKLQAVQDYLAGYGSQDLKSYGAGGSQIMTKGRKTKFEERVEIVYTVLMIYRILKKKHNHDFNG